MADGYQVIARRWRPKQFDELVGQEHIVRTLKNAISSNRIAHAYLFVGPRGTGKTTTARIFAKALNAEGGPTPTPSDESDLSQAIMNGSCMDVIEIDGASNNSVDYIRDLRESCQYSPAQATFKIYIIDEVHMLSSGAFNALLKTLEEPPSHVKFIFATTEAHKVLDTITSRCQRFEFRPISEELIAERLKMIADEEGIKVEETALFSIARLANGGMRDAQSILDQMISFCGKDITTQNVLEVYGLAAPERIKELATAMVTARYDEVIRLVDNFADEGLDLYRVLTDLQALLRESLLGAIRQGGSSDSLGMALSTESYIRMLEVLHSGESAVKTGLSEKVNFEVTLLKAIEQSRARPIDSVIKQLSSIAADLPEEVGKKKIEPPASPEKVSKAQQPEKPAKAPEPAPENPPAPEPKIQAVQESPPEPPPSADTIEDDSPPLDYYDQMIEQPNDSAEAPPESAPYQAPDSVPLEPLVEQLPAELKQTLEQTLSGQFRKARKYRKDDWIS